MSITQKQLAAVLGVAPSLISRYKHQGMPVDDVRAAVRWLDRYVQPRVRTPLDAIRAKEREARKRRG